MVAPPGAAPSDRTTARQMSTWRIDVSRRMLRLKLLISCDGCVLMGPFGGREMRWLGIVVLCVALGGCYATGADVRAKLGQDYVGKNVDALVLRWGPPASSFKMNGGDTAYSWQLA